MNDQFSHLMRKGIPEVSLWKGLGNLGLKDYAPRMPVFAIFF